MLSFDFDDSEYWDRADEAYDEKKDRECEDA